MLKNSSFLRRSRIVSGVCQCRNPNKSRSFVSRTPIYRLDQRTKETIEEIRQLRHKLEAETKRRQLSNILDRVSEDDVQALYKQVSATPQPRPKQIKSDYLENLRIKFLDTRPTLQLPEGQKTEEYALTEKAREQPSQLTVDDYAQLIYANALAKRPVQAEQALQLMKDHGRTPTLRCYNHLLDAYANAQQVEGAIGVFRRIKENGLEPDMYSYSTLIKAFVQDARVDDAFIVFENMKKLGLYSSQPIYTTLINGCIKTGQLERAWNLFDSMRLSYHQPDEVSFTLMLHACAKNGEVERALNLFEDMIGCQLYPTDVTFNVLINACAKRPDYFEAAFDLLYQMRTVYGFEPDQITYNTLLAACATKKDLKMAREVFRVMLQDAEQNGEESRLKPDEHTFGNLFRCYANYNPPTKLNPSAEEEEDNNPASSEDDALVPHTLLPPTLPKRRSEVVQEAKKIFEYVVENALCSITSTLLTGYLNVHISQRQRNECVELYLNAFERFGVERIGYTFLYMLRFAYDNRDTELAWKIWEDYQQFLEDRLRRDEQQNGTMDIIERKQREARMLRIQTKEGWTPKHQRELAILMANTLARGNDLKNAILIIQAELPRRGANAPKISELRPAYNKCIQLEDEEAKARLLSLCVRERKLKPDDWRFRK